MLRTQIQFTAAQIEALRARAARLGLSVSEVVRRAVDAWVVADSTPEELKRRAIETAGRFASGKSDVAGEHDRYLTEAYRS